MNHLSTAKIAFLMAGGAGEEATEACRHMAETCPVCGERLAEVEALMKRFRHWDAEMVWREGVSADSLFETLLQQGQNPECWAVLVEQDAAYQTWCVAWVALEGAQKLVEGDATQAQARNLALLAAKIASRLSTSYHPNSIAELKALAHATAAVAEPLGADWNDTLREVVAAVTALDQGSGDPAVASEVMDLLSKVFRQTPERKA